MSFTLQLLAYAIGIIIVFVSHIYMVIKPAAFNTASKMKSHAYLNLLAGLLIAFYFTSTYRKVYP